jgi:hypothetical protein
VKRYIGVSVHRLPLSQNMSIRKMREKEKKEKGSAELAANQQQAIAFRVRVSVLKQKPFRGFPPNPIREATPQYSP